MVVFLGLAAAVLYGSGDFLGDMATRRAHVLTVLTLVETAAVTVALAAALMSGGPASLPGLTWGFSAGVVGGLGLIIFYVGLAAGPMLGFDAPGIDAEFFPDRNYKTILVVNIGKPGENPWFPRLPRLQHEDFVQYV